jgi:hypothetical protein
MLTADLIAEIPDAASLRLIQDWLDDLSTVAAARPQAPAIAALCARRGVSPRTVHNKLAALRTGGPLALLDGRARRRAAAAPVGHRSPAFKAWVHRLYFQIARPNATPSVQAIMLDALRAWRLDPTNPALVIPGYSTPPPYSAEARYRHPAGWSQRNLNLIKPDAYQRAEATIGRHTGNTMLPAVLTTRVGLQVGEVYMLDDQYYDLSVHWGDQVVRPVGLNLLDLASGCDVTRGIRPELRNNPEGEKSLNRRDTLWLIVHHLTVHGYCPDRCRLVLESGTSTVDPEFARHLSLVSDRIIHIDIGEVSKDIVAGVLLPSKGNPRFKAARESWFNLLRNRMGHLPLALGMAPDDWKPESTDRLAAEDRRLLAIAEQLPPAVLNDLQFEGLPWSRFILAANYISDAINRREEHQLEGWAASGRERVQYRIGDQWIEESEYLALAPETRVLIVDRMRRGEKVSRIRRLSPQAVWDAGRSRLVRISPFRWHLLVPRQYAIQRRVPADRQLRLTSRDFGPEPIHFLPHYRMEDGSERPLPAGSEVLLYICPHHPDFALLCDLDGRPLGLVFAVQVGTRFDEDALLDQYASRARLRTDISGHATHHQHQLAEHRTQRRKANADLLREAGIDPKIAAKIEKPYRPKSKPKTKKPGPPKNPSNLDTDPDTLGILHRP